MNFIILLLIALTSLNASSSSEEVFYEIDLRYWVELEGIYNSVEFRYVNGTVKLDERSRIDVLKGEIQEKQEKVLILESFQEINSMNGQTIENSNDNQTLRGILEFLDEIFKLNKSELKGMPNFEEINADEHGLNKFFRIKGINTGFGSGNEVTGCLEGEETHPDELYAKFSINFPTSAYDVKTGGIVNFRKVPGR